MIINNSDGKAKQSTAYAWGTGTISKAGLLAATDITTVVGFTNLFAPFNSTSLPKPRRPHKIKVLASAAAYIKLNGGDVITIGVTSPFEADDLIVESMGVSTGGAAVTITVYLQ